MTYIENGIKIMVAENSQGHPQQKVTLHFNISGRVSMKISAFTVTEGVHGVQKIPWGGVDKTKNKIFIVVSATKSKEK